MAILDGINQRQRDFALFQIAKHGFAELFSRGGKIEQIIDQLKSQASIAAIFRESFFALAFQAAEHGSEARAAAEQASGLVRRKTQGVLFTHVDASDFFQLNELALDHFLREIDE